MQNTSTRSIPFGALFFGCSLAAAFVWLVVGNGDSRRGPPVRAHEEEPIDEGEPTAGASTPSSAPVAASRAATPAAHPVTQSIASTDSSTSTPTTYQAVLSEQLRRDPPDPAWAAHSKVEVAGVMSRLSLEGLRMRDVECSGKLCALDFDLDDEALLSSLRRLAVDFPWPATGYYQQQEDDPKHVVMFVAREGHQLPPLAQR